METINERFKDLRKSCGKTQEEWGKIIGITKNGVCDIESGRRKVTEKHIIALSNFKEPGRKSINIEWLRTGSGDMFIERSRNQMIADFVNEVMEEPDDSIRKQFIEMLCSLDVEGWETITKFFSLAKNNSDK